VASNTSIVRIYPFSRYVVILTCGHRFEATKAELDTLQLFVGKRSDCAKCKAEEVNPR
jgi:hypothetical protein